MVNMARRKGTAAETLITDLMRDTWWPNARRHGLNGSKDIGDINTGNPKLVVEVKADKALDYPRFLRETEAERINAQADIGVCVIKPPGLGERKKHLWWMLMSDKTWRHLHDVPERGEGYYKGPAVLWFEGNKLVPRAFQPGLWLHEAYAVVEQMGIEARPGAHKISSAAGSMRFLYLPTGLEILAACGYGGQ